MPLEEYAFEIRNGLLGLVKDSSKVLSGITIQRALSFLMVPAIARLFAPEDYGVFQVGASVCAWLSVAGSLALESSIAVSESKEQAVLRTLGTSIIGVISGIFFWVVIYVMQPYLRRLFSPEIVKAILLMSLVMIPLQVAAISLRNLLGYLGKFGSFPVSDVLSVLANFLVLICSYLLFWRDYHSLILAAVAALVVQISIFVYALESFQPFTGFIHLRGILRELWKARDFAKFYLPANVVNAGSTQLPTTLLALVFPTNVIGLFAMAQRVIETPAMLTGRALGQVFYPKAAKAYMEREELGQITWETFIYSCKLALFPLFFIAASSGIILPVLLGARWSGIVPYVAILLPMAVIRSIETPIGIGFIFSILNKQYNILVGNLLLALCKFVPLVLSLNLVKSYYLVILFYAMGSTIGYAALLVWVFVSVSISIKEALFSTMKYSLISIICVLPILLSLSNSKLYFMIICMILSITIYCLFAWFEFLDERQRSLIKCEVLKRIGF